MISGLLLLGIIGAIAFLLVRKISTKSSGERKSGHSVRRFFQYALQFGLTVVVGIGITGLLNRLISPATFITADQVSLARNTSFVLVGLPILWGVLNWTKRSVKTDPAEVNSLAWAAYFLVATVASLGTAMVGLAGLLSWAIADEKYSSYALAQTLVWTTIWYLHFWINQKYTPRDKSKFLYLFNSLIGLITSAVGLALIISGIVKQIWGFSGKEFLLTGTDPIKSGAVTFLIGVPVWVLYWLKLGLKSNRDMLWFGYILLPGVAGGLITAINAAGLILYKALVWIIGNPISQDSYLHFNTVPIQTGAFMVGLLLLWYHQSLAKIEQQTKRSEIQRTYEYLISGIALITTTAGVILIIVAIFDAIGRGSVIVSNTAVNTLLAAFTLILIGAPVWVYFWQKIQRYSKQNKQLEANSGVRRIYLFLLFGFGAVVSVISLITSVFILFESIFTGGSSSELVREIRYPISLLVGTVVIAGYHWTIYNQERDLVATQVKALKHLILIAPLDKAGLEQLKLITSAKIEIFELPMHPAFEWPITEIINQIDSVKSEKLVLELNPEGAVAVNVIR